jgi:hypothetical protein
MQKSGTFCRLKKPEVKSLDDVPLSSRFKISCASCDFSSGAETRETAD